jgi:large subunit ribosomal protein L13
MSDKKALKTSQKKYSLFDCEKYILGRMSAKAAFILQGKDNPQFSPNKPGDSFVIVINSDKILVSGKKMKDKMYHSFSGYPGGISSRNLEEQIAKDSRKVVWDSIYGMLPKNKLRDVMMKKIFIFKDSHHNISNGDIEEIIPIKS